MVIIFFGLGCVNNKDGGPGAWDPSDVFMSRHIRTAHGVILRNDVGADIMVQRKDKKVSIVFTERFIKKAGEDIVWVLGLGGVECVMSRKEYLSFLNKLHAYLTVTPVR